MPRSTAPTVEAYIADAPAALRPRLRKLRAAIKSAAPRATETISYRMPYYSYRGRLIYWAVSTDHIGLYLLGRAKTKFPELRPYLSGVSTAQFPFDGVLPITLIRKIVRERVKENDEKAAKKR